MEHESESDTNFNRYGQDCQQRFSTETGELGNKRTSGDHPFYSIDKLDQNNDNSSGDLRGLAVIRFLWKTISKRWCEKLRKEKIVIIIIITITLSTSELLAWCLFTKKLKFTGFCRPNGPQIESEGRRTSKNKKITGLFQRTEKLWKIKVTVIPFIIWTLKQSLKTRKRNWI